MGNKGAKGGAPPKGNKKGPGSVVPAPSGQTDWPGAPVRNNLPPKHPHDLTESDYAFLIMQTGQTRSDIKQIFDQFMANNPDGKLDKREFVRLYANLRPEPTELLDEISESIFRAFDVDGNGYINFNEFMVAYSLTSRGDLRRKLEYAFALYDLDGNGYLDRNELSYVITGMLDLLGADKKSYNVQQLAQECMSQLDATNDGRYSKESNFFQDEFIEGLMSNYSLRALMSPFN